MTQNRLFNKHNPLCTILASVLVTSVGYSQEAQPSAENDPLDEGWIDTSDEEFDDSIDLLFEDFDIVITAARSEQKTNRASVPVSILNTQDIHYSGASEIPHLLAFMPGVDALQVDNNRWALGVRGLHQTFSDRTLFLIDGRNASNPIHGGIDFQRYPLFWEDIKQIEAVRGPGGAAWGANAFNGVINIIEKSPFDTTGVMISQRLNDDGDSKTNFRVGDATEEFAWRFSGEFNDIEQTDTTNILSGVTVAPANPNDFLRSQKFDLDTIHKLNDEMTLEFGIGGSHIERGDSPFLALQLNIDERIDLIRSHAKLSKEFGDGASGYVQWYGTYHDVNRPSMYRYSAYDNNIDAQYAFTTDNDHRITVGGTARFINFDISEPRATDSLPTGSYAEQWIGAFIGDQWDINESWSAETQLRVDWYSETQVDWSGRAALLRTFGDSDQHTLRLAIAKAFRTPQTALRELSSERIPVGGGLFGVNLIPTSNLDNEQLYSGEIGYTGLLADGLTLRSDVYYQIYQDLTGVVVLPEPTPTLGRLFFTVDNIGDATAYGFESELKYQRDQTTVSLWYAYNDFDYEMTDQNARAFRPAKHKVGITARTALTEDITLNANYRYTDSTVGDTTDVIDAFHRLDITATLAPADWNLEIQFGFNDVFDETDLRITDHTATGITQEGPGRNFFVQLHYTF